MSPGQGRGASLCARGGVHPRAAFEVAPRLSSKQPESLSALAPSGGRPARRPDLAQQRSSRPLASAAAGCQSAPTRRSAGACPQIPAISRPPIQIVRPAYFCHGSPKGLRCSTSEPRIPPVNRDRGSSSILCESRASEQLVGKAGKPFPPSVSRSAPKQHPVRLNRCPAAVSQRMCSSLAQLSASAIATSGALSNRVAARHRSSNAGLFPVLLMADLVRRDGRATTPFRPRRPGRLEQMKPAIPRSAPMFWGWACLQGFLKMQGSYSGRLGSRAGGTATRASIADLRNEVPNVTFFAAQESSVFTRSVQ